jgi:ribosomal protein L5
MATAKELQAALSPKRWAKHKKQIVPDATERLVTRSKQEAPKRTRKLERSIYADIRGDKATIRARAPYAGFVISGTPPHIIRAKDKPLRFQIGGRVVFARSVNHPGTKPNDFFSRALQAEQRRIEDEMAEVGGRFFAEVARA